MTRVVRTLQQALTASDRSAPEHRMHVFDESTLRRRLGWRPHILYVATRDCRRPTRAGEATWRMDSVEYPAHDLPTGELNRSIGHWNPVDQEELFHVASGHVLILTVSPTGQANVVECRAGSVVAVAPGSWHLTYVWGGPARVVNIYSTPVAVVDRDGDGKYFRRPTPRLGARRVGGGYGLFGADLGRLVVRGPIAAPRLTELVTGPVTLENLLSDAGGVPGIDELLTTLVERAILRL